jgi:hypothetical protein
VPAALLRCDAADALDGLQGAYRARFGKPLGVTDSYQSYASQVDVKRRKPGLAATPGTSSQGVAVDVVVSGYSDPRDEMVEVARRKLANLDERRELDVQRDRVGWAIVNEDGLVPPRAAAAIRERLEREGFTAEQIKTLGVSEASIRPIARMRQKP